MTTPYEMHRRRNVRGARGAAITRAAPHDALEPCAALPARTAAGPRAALETRALLLVHRPATARGPAAARVRLVVPPPLRKGDLVGVAAPGFAVERDRVEAGV